MEIGGKIKAPQRKTKEKSPRFHSKCAGITRQDGGKQKLKLNENNEL